MRNLEKWYWWAYLQGSNRDADIENSRGRRGWDELRGALKRMYYHVCKTDCCCSVSQSCPILCDPMDCSILGFPVLHCLPEFAQTRVHWVEDAIQSSLLCHPLLLPPSIFLSIRGFSSELALCIRKPKYWSVSFSISPSNEYSALISFRTDWFDLLAV